MRIKTRWNNQDKQRTIEETASALSFTLWRMCMQSLLNLENEGFQTDTQMQRLTVIEEYLAFLLHAVDRIVYNKMDEEERAIFINALAKKLADYVQDNGRDLGGAGDYRAPFIELLNDRMDGYAEFGFFDFEPSFQMSRYFGDAVTRVLGEHQRKWVTTQVIDIEVPFFMKTMKRAITSLLPELPREETA
ncbi:uncharacterized protein FOKN1_1931 [Thiohalobacter thiocyanaticus]|uniref:Uncharacterized protein n=1 Tax=Thiohalobacter thiocyanaticus TaxID=585455 RepID=A0A1Z4VRP5_9GAMM|nr:hypothetical protein [Thiohalobacter thiocyanaticus]BAZ94311.1 uncharacterized protein FOKN1_1931 [Thiohalobacter thiocyanaticus]